MPWSSTPAVVPTTWPEVVLAAHRVVHGVPPTTPGQALLDELVRPQAHELLALKATAYDDVTPTIPDTPEGLL